MTRICDVSICYRLSGGGFRIAAMMHERFEQLNFRTFMDAESLDGGMFDEQLRAQIDNCEDIIVIIGLDGQDRYQNENRRVQQETAYAITIDRNIVPIFLHDYSSLKESFSADINEGAIFQGLENSRKLLNAFFVEQQKMRQSKRPTQNRIKKQLLPIVLIVIVFADTFLFMYNYNRQKEVVQSQQMSTEMIAKCPMGFTNNTCLFTTVGDVNIVWKRSNIDFFKTNDSNKNAELKKELVRQSLFRK
jgi:hypothetical protein